MNDMLIKLNILIDILLDKKNVLLQIENICHNEKTIYIQPSTEAKATILKEMAQEKQKHIDKVLQCDDVFQITFDSIKGEFDKLAVEHRDEVSSLQRLIKEIMEIDVRIRNTEKTNKKYINYNIEPKRKASDVEKNYILSQYKKNNIKK